MDVLRMLYGYALVILLMCYVDAATEFHGPPMHFRVTSVLNEPYLMINWNQNGNSTSPNDGYQGYIKDLMDSLANKLKFSYLLTPVVDGQYGVKTREGWNGMVRELLDNKADIAAAPMFITDQRLEVVTFTRPFLKVRATIIMRRRPDGSDRPDSTINSVEDLLDRNRIVYGTMGRGIILREFRASNHTVYSQLWANMRSFPGALTETNEEGIERARKEEHYAFILPSTIGQYIVKRLPCNLIAVDEFLMEKGYGLAMLPDFPYFAEFDQALGVLEKSGYLSHLYNKWWVNQSQCSEARSNRASSQQRITSTGSASTVHINLVITILPVLYVLDSCTLLKYYYSHR